MPRPQISTAGRIVEFFKTSPLETADLVLGLCKDEVSTRQQKSRDAKARAAAPASVAGPAAVATKKAKGAKKVKAAVKKSHHKKKPAPAVEPGSGGHSIQPPALISEAADEAGEAGDAPADYPADYQA